MGFKKYCCHCGPFKPRYQRLVDNIFPSDPNDGLVRSNMEKLTFFALSSPEKLDRIGEYLAKKLTRDIARRRYGRIFIAMDALDQLLVACHAQTLNVFVESFLKMVQKLLECDEPDLNILATNSFVKFSNIEEDAPSYHRRYDFFISKFASMCHSNIPDLRARSKIRKSGLKGIHAVIRKTVSDDLQVNIYEPEHMKKIIPSILYNMHDPDLIKSPVHSDTTKGQEFNTNSHDKLISARNGISNLSNSELDTSQTTKDTRLLSPIKDVKESGLLREKQKLLDFNHTNTHNGGGHRMHRKEKISDLAETCLRELISKASFATLKSVLQPLMEHFDYHKLWSAYPSDSFVTYVLQLIMYCVKPQYTHLVIDMLLMHLNEHEDDPFLRANIMNAISQIINMATLSSIGPSIHQWFNKMFKDLKQSVQLNITNEDKQKGENLFQQAIIHTMGEFATNLPDYQKIQVMIFIMNQVPPPDSYDKRDLMLFRPTENITSNNVIDNTINDHRKSSSIDNKDPKISLPITGGNKPKVETRITQDTKGRFKTEILDETKLSFPSNTVPSETPQNVQNTDLDDYVVKIVGPKLSVSSEASKIKQPSSTLLLFKRATAQKSSSIEMDNYATVHHPLDNTEKRTFSPPTKFGRNLRSHSLENETLVLQRPSSQNEDLKDFVVIDMPGENRITPVETLEQVMINRNKNIKLQIMVLQSLLKVATKFNSVQYSATFPSNFLIPLLKMSIVLDETVRLLVQQILHTLIDRHDNLAKLEGKSLSDFVDICSSPFNVNHISSPETTAIEIIPTIKQPLSFWDELNVEKCSHLDTLFIRKNGPLLYSALYETTLRTNNSLQNFKAIFITFALIIIEVGSVEETFSDVLKLMFILQKKCRNLPFYHGDTPQNTIKIVNIPNNIANNNGNRDDGLYMPISGKDIGGFEINSNASVKSLDPDLLKMDMAGQTDDYKLRNNEIPNFQDIFSRDGFELELQVHALLSACISFSYTAFYQWFCPFANLHGELNDITTTVPDNVEQTAKTLIFSSSSMDQIAGMENNDENTNTTSNTVNNNKHAIDINHQSDQKEMENINHVKFLNIHISDILHRRNNNSHLLSRLMLPVYCWIQQKKPHTEIFEMVFNEPALSDVLLVQKCQSLLHDDTLFFDYNVYKDALLQMGFESSKIDQSLTLRSLVTYENTTIDGSNPMVYGRGSSDFATTNLSPTNSLQSINLSVGGSSSSSSSISGKNDVKGGGSISSHKQQYGQSGDDSSYFFDADITSSTDSNTTDENGEKLQQRRKKRRYNLPGYQDINALSMKKIFLTDLSKSQQGKEAKQAKLRQLCDWYKNAPFEDIIAKAQSKEIDSRQTIQSLVFNNITRSPLSFYNRPVKPPAYFTTHFLHSDNDNNKKKENDGLTEQTFMNKYQQPTSLVDMKFPRLIVY